MRSFTARGFADERTRARRTALEGLWFQPTTVGRGRNGAGVDSGEGGGMGLRVPREGGGSLLGRSGRHTTRIAFTLVHSMPFSFW